MTTATEVALRRLAESTAEAVASVLRTLCGDVVDRGPVSLPPPASPFLSLPLPAVCTNVSYVDGAAGGNLFVLTPFGAKRLAAAMTGEDVEAVEDGEVTELELSAVSEAANQMMAAAAAATSAVLGEQVEIAPPQTRRVATAEEVAEVYEATPHATTVTLAVAGHACRLVQLVPNAFVVRMTRALADRDAESSGAGLGARSGPAALPGESVRRIPVQVSAELGRVRMRLGEAVGLPPGSVVALDRATEEPIDLFVNGWRFATGRLIVVDDSEWAVRLEEVFVGASDHGFAAARPQEGEGDDG